MFVSTQKSSVTKSKAHLEVRWNFCTVVQKRKSLVTDWVKQMIHFIHLLCCFLGSFLVDEMLMSTLKCTIWKTDNWTCLKPCTCSWMLYLKSFTTITTELNVHTHTRSLTDSPHWLTAAWQPGGTRGKIFSSPWLQGPGMTATALIILGWGATEVGRRWSVNSN